MADQPATTSHQAKHQRVLFYLLCVLLIGNFLYRMLLPAHEYPPRMALYLDLVVDAGCIIGLFAVRKAGPQALFVIALIAGVALFGIRMKSDSSWWTGHWTYSLDR
jgi:hypothetical protein